MLHLIAMKGHPATGKSTLARRLAASLNWPLFDKDDIKDHTYLVAQGNELAYTILWQLVDTQLSLGLSVIVDSPLSYPLAYLTACTLAAKYEARLLVLETTLDDRQWQERLNARPPDESKHKISGWAAMQELLVDYAGCWSYPVDPAHHLAVDSTQAPERLVALVCEWFRVQHEHGQSSAT